MIYFSSSSIGLARQNQTLNSLNSLLSTCALRASRLYLSLIGDQVRSYLHTNNEGLLEEEEQVERKTLKWLLLNETSKAIIQEVISASLRASIRRYGTLKQAEILQDVQLRRKMKELLGSIIRLEYRQVKSLMSVIDVQSQSDHNQSYMEEASSDKMSSKKVEKVEQIKKPKAKSTKEKLKKGSKKKKGKVQAL